MNHDRFKVRLELFTPNNKPCNWMITAKYSANRFIKLTHKCCKLQTKQLPTDSIESKTVNRCQTSRCNHARFIHSVSEVLMNSVLFPMAIYRFVLILVWFLFEFKIFFLFLGRLDDCRKHSQFCTHLVRISQIESAFTLSIFVVG